MACNHARWVDHPPENFQGNLIETSDDILLGIERPLHFTIMEDSMFITAEENVELEALNKRYRIVKVMLEDDDSIVIFVGDPDGVNAAEDRYELSFDKKGFLCIGSLVASANGSETSKFFLVRKFVFNDKSI